LTGVNALHQGVELDFNSKPIKDLEITGMISIGDWTWQNNALGYLFNSNGLPIHIVSGQPVTATTPDTIRVNIKGVRVGNSAQSTAALGINYQILKGFRIGIDGNYYGRNYSSFTISTTFDPNAQMVQPWMIPDAVTFDFNANYRFKIGTFDAALIGNIYNLLNQEYIADSKDGADHTWKTAQVFYGFGRTWSLNLKIKF
jgi:outer membrane receptor for Fe3+-dicitrate